MILKKIAQWIKEKLMITVYKQGGAQISTENMRTVSEQMAAAGASAEELAKSMTAMAAACIQATEEPRQKEPENRVVHDRMMTNNWRKMHGIPMIRRQPARRAKRKQKRR